MTDPRREGEGSRGARTTAGSTERSGAPRNPDSNHATEGTDRDFDEQEVSKNQGHGHPREERGAQD